jgi:hypothetical protein
MVCAPEVRYAPHNRRRRNDRAIRVEAPFDAVQRGDACTFVSTGVLRVSTEHGAFANGKRRNKEEYRDQGRTIIHVFNGWFRFEIQNST